MEKEFKYQEIARALEQLVQAKLQSQTPDGGASGTAGFPSIRQTAGEWQVSPNTVVEAYRLLESRGIIRARSRSGWQMIVPNRMAKGVAEVSKDLEPRGAELSVLMHNAILTSHSSTEIPLGIAAPAGELIPQGMLSRFFRQALTRESSWGYDFAPGNIHLRRQIADLMLRLGTGIGADPSSIGITTGVTEGLSLVLSQVTKPGDLLLIESPCYSGYLILARQLGLQLLPVPTNPVTGLDPQGLEGTLSRYPQAKVLLVSPNYANPVGSFMPEGNRRRIAELCRARGLHIIENDIAGALRLDGPHAPALCSMDPQGIYVSSFSKCLSPSLRLGWIHGPEEIMEPLNRSMLARQLGSSALTQSAVTDLLASGSFYRHLTEIRRKARTRRDAMALEIEQSFPKGSRFYIPQGGLVCWIELPQGSDGYALQAVARKEQIGIAPGSIFSIHGEFVSCLRLGYGAANIPAIRRGLATLSRLILLQREEPV